MIETLNRIKNQENRIFGCQTREVHKFLHSDTYAGSSIEKKKKILKQSFQNQKEKQ